ncbi:MAG: PilZ domain-containing protein [Deferribacterota bacterium]|nr:PilZ domain-containing protein [Deferribacterota bacterium]
MSSGKLKVDYDDDIRRVFVIIESYNPMVVKYNGDINELIDGAIKFQIQYYDEGMLVKKNVKIVKVEGNLMHFNVIEMVTEDIKRKEFRVDYKGPIYLKKISKDEINKYKTIIDEEMGEYKNSIVYKVRDFIKSADEIRSIISQFLIEINTKLDKILFSIDEKKNKLDLITAKSLDISGGGVCIFCFDKIADESSILYIKFGLEDYQYYQIFSALGEVVSVKETKMGYKYGIKYIYIDRDSREFLIKYAIEKERLLARTFKLL